MSNEAMKLALEAKIHNAGMNPIMQGGCYLMHPEAMQKVIDAAIREALAEQPAQRTWVGLTNDEYDAICDKHSAMSDFDFLEDIEAKLKEENT